MATGLLVRLTERLPACRRQHGGAGEAKRTGAHAQFAVAVDVKRTRVDLRAARVRVATKRVRCASQSVCIAGQGERAGADLDQRAADGAGDPAGGVVGVAGDRAPKSRVGAVVAHAEPNGRTVGGYQIKRVLKVVPIRRIAVVIPALEAAKAGRGDTSANNSHPS